MAVLDECRTTTTQQQKHDNCAVRPMARGTEMWKTGAQSMQLDGPEPTTVSCIVYLRQAHMSQTALLEWERAR